MIQIENCTKIKNVWQPLIRKNNKKKIANQTLIHSPTCHCYSLYDIIFYSLY